MASSYLRFVAVALTPAWLLASMTAGATLRPQDSAISTSTATVTIQPEAQIDALVDLQTYRLWVGRAPEASGEGPTETPTVTVFRPQWGKSNKTAVIVLPGGGYVGLAGNLEGRQVADWFAARGITAFLLKYRVGPRARLPIPLLDGVRAMRFVRANAEAFKIDPTRIGLIGFSAGGHLAATVATTPKPGDPRSVDPLDRVSSRPDFLILGYPWLEGTMIDGKGGSQYCMFAGKNCSPQDYQTFLPTRSVTNDTPPTFIYHTTADNLVPATGSLRFYEALYSHKVPVELHVFATGEHGTGLGGTDQSLSQWPALLEAWLRDRNLLASDTCLHGNRTRAMNCRP